MIIAIACAGNTLDNAINRVFGRAPFFAFYHTRNKHLEFIANPYKDNLSKVGIAATDFIASHKATKIIAGEFGIKLKDRMMEHQIQMIKVNENKTIAEVVALLDIHNNYS